MLRSILLILCFTFLPFAFADNEITPLPDPVTSGKSPTNMRIATQPLPKDGELLKVAWDCFISNTNIQCETLRKLFFDEDFLIRESDPKNADVIIKVTMWPLGDNEQYQFDFTGKGKAPSGRALPSFRRASPDLVFRQSLTPEAKVLDLAHVLVQSMAQSYHTIEKVERSPDGQHLLLTYTGLGASTANANTGNTAKTPWYFNLKLGGMTTGQQGFSQIRFFAASAAAYDTPKLLLNFYANFAYRYVALNSDTAQNLSGNGFVQAAQSTSEHWSVMAWAKGSHDPSSNWKGRGQGAVGIEYELVPYIEVNDTAFNVSYIVAGTYENYIAQNIYNHMQEAFASHALTLYLVKHWARVDLSTSVVGTTQLNDVTKWAVGGNVGAKFYITDTLALSLMGSGGYKANLINNPADPNAINPLIALVGAGGNVSPYSYSLMMQFTYFWGNVLLQQKDLRWQVTPDQVPVNF